MKLAALVIRAKQAADAAAALRLAREREPARSTLVAVLDQVSDECHIATDDLIDTLLDNETLGRCDTRRIVLLTCFA
jgi:hypothetical protein